MKAIRNIYWAAMLAFAILYAAGFRFISPEMLFVPIAANALIVALRAIPSLLGADIETLAYAIILGISLPILLLGFILSSAGSEFRIEDMAIAGALTIGSLALGQKMDRLAFFEILVLGSMFVAPLMLSDRFIPYFLFMLLALLLWARVGRPDGRRKDAGAMLFGIDLSRKASMDLARPLIIVLPLSAIFLAGILYAPAAIVPLSIAFVSCGRLLEKD